MIYENDAVKKWIIQYYGNTNEIIKYNKICVLNKNVLEWK